MTTTINADTTVGGAVVTGDASGVLALQAAGVTKLTVNGSGVTLATPLAVASGGTGGSATPTAGGVVYGTGTVQAVTAAGTSGQVLTSAGASAPTWSTISTSVGNNLVFVNSGNGPGSTATKIWRFTTTTTSVGTAITYADSASDGASFTINETGIYSMTVVMESGGTNTFGVSVNSNQLTTNIQSINVANRLVMTTTSAAGFLMSTSVTRRLVATDVIRVHTNGNMSNGGESTNFAIVKVGT